MPLMKSRKDSRMEGEESGPRKGGVARWALPFGAACLGLAMAALLMMPMLKMSPQNVPVALLSLDQGVTVGDAHLNAGELMVEKLTGQAADADEEGTAASEDASGSADAAQGDAESAFEGLSLFGEEAEGEGEDDAADDGTASGYVTSDAVNWIVVDTQAELDELLSAGEVYAALTIPADFSRTVASSAGRTALGTQLMESLPSLADGAAALESGAGSLADGSSTLAGGMSQLASGASALESGLGSLPEAAAQVQGGAAALGEGLEKLEAGASSLEEGVLTLQGGNQATQQAVAAALAALSADDPDMQAALEYLQQASATASAVDQGAESLADGAATLSSKLSASKQGASSLSDGLGKLASGASALASGASSLTSGVGQLESGAGSLADGAGALHEGTETLADGLGTANEALSSLSEAAGEAADEASGNAAEPTIKLVINQGKNPMVSNSLGSAISSMASSAGVTFDIEYENPLPEGMSMGFTHMILMMLTYLSSYITAVVVSNTFKPQRGRGARRSLGCVGIQVAYAVACALVIGFCAAFVISHATGAAIAFVDLALFVALASFAFQMLVLGALNLFGMAGMVVPIGLLVVGMGAAYLPMEFLPAFWQNWVCPWDPLRFMADGYRGILYMGQGFWNESSPALLTMAAVGAALTALKLVLIARGGDEHGGKHAGEGANEGERPAIA